MSSCVVPLGIVSARAQVVDRAPGDEPETATRHAIAATGLAVLTLPAEAGADRRRWAKAVCGLRLTPGGFLPLRAAPCRVDALIDRLAAAAVPLGAALAEVDGMAEFAVCLALPAATRPATGFGRAWLASRAAVLRARRDAETAALDAVLGAARDAALTVVRHRVAAVPRGGAVDIAILVPACGAEGRDAALPLSHALARRGRTPLAAAGPLPCFSFAAGLAGVGIG